MAEVSGQVRSEARFGFDLRVTSEAARRFPLLAHALSQVAFALHEASCRLPDVEDTDEANEEFEVEIIGKLRAAVED